MKDRQLEILLALGDCKHSLEFLELLVDVKYLVENKIELIGEPD